MPAQLPYTVLGLRPREACPISQAEGLSYSMTESFTNAGEQKPVCVYKVHLLSITLYSLCLNQVQKPGYSSVHVAVYNTQKRYSIDFKAVATLAEKVILAEGRFCNEVSVHFVGTKKICALHAEYFDDPSVTDCISFPIDNLEGDPYSVLGEVFVCPETACNYVKKHGGIFYEEITLYIVHGLLHLLGYDDIDEADCRIMREREHYHMENLKAEALQLIER